MASALQIVPPDAIRRIQGAQTVTIAWMSVEALVSLFAAWRAGSPALLAFGGDSAIELFSAVIVLWRFRATDAHEDVEKRVASVAGALLFVLAAFVAISSVTRSAGLYRTQAHGFRHRNSGGCRSRNAVTCERKAAAVKSYKQCCAEGGRCTVAIVCLSLPHRLGGTGDQLDLARKTGQTRLRL
jgi:hypothetical protein